MKRKALISFSGGETSGYMLWWLLNHKADEYDFTVLFANTGRENQETLDFVNNCAKKFGIEVILLEAVIRFKIRYWDKTKVFTSYEEKEEFYNSFSQEELTSKYRYKVNKKGHEFFRKCVEEVRIGTTYKVVTYETATRNQDWKVRNNTPYEMMVKKYGIANIASKISTRELKERPLHAYMKSLGFKNKKDYTTFIGIRVDEFDRMSVDKNIYDFKYPLITWKPTTKPQINFWWSIQEFRLNLKGWEGNCVTCYKKSKNKLIRIMQDSSWKFEFDEYLEEKYGYYIPRKRIELLRRKGKELPELPLRIFRDNMSVNQLKEESLKTDTSKLKDDSLANEQEDESCEVYSQCGINN